MKRTTPVAYSATVKGFDEREPSIVWGVNAGKARYRVYLALLDASYDARFQDIKIKRAPEYDEIADHPQIRNKCLGVWYADILLEERRKKIEHEKEIAA